MATARRSARVLAKRVFEEVSEPITRPSLPKKIKRESKPDSIENESIAPVSLEPKKEDPVSQTPRKRKKKTEAPLIWPDRWTKSLKAIGSHVSISNGAENAPSNALTVGGNAFALFLRNQRQWNSKPFSEETINLFPLRCQGKASIEGEPFGDGRGFDRQRHIIPHGSYLVNLANPNPEKWQKSYDAFLDELKRAEALGIHHFNFHPGSTTGAATREEGYAAIARGINKAHKETSYVTLLLENMASRGNIIGGSFEDLAAVIALVEEKSRVGVCFDTCHALAAGHDIRTPQAYEKTMAEFDRVIGLKYLKAFHFNDSKGELDSHKDRHENIGMGHIGLLGFASFLADKRFDGLPFILETPMLDGTLDAQGIGGPIWQKEIRMLYLLEVLASGMPAEGLAHSIEHDKEIQLLFGEIKTAVEDQRKVVAAKKAEKKANADAKKKQPKKEAKESAPDTESDT